MTEFGPRPRSAGRYCGNCAETGLPEGEALGFADGDVAGLGVVAGLEGVAEGFVCTWTSAAERMPVAVAAAARVNQNLNIESLRNAVLALSQDQFLSRRYRAALVPLFFVGLIAVRVSVAGRLRERTLMDLGAV